MDDCTRHRLPARRAVRANALAPAGQAADQSGFGAELRQYKQLFDNAIVGICFMVDRHFLRVNRRMEEILCYPPGGLTGLSVRQVYARQEDFEAVGRVLNAFPAENRYVHEHTLVTRDGEPLWCMISGSRIETDASRRAFVWVVQDLTDKKRAEDELARVNLKLEQRVRLRTTNLRRTNEALEQEVTRRRASERAMIESREKYRALIRNAPLGIAITGNDGSVIEINPAIRDLFETTDASSFTALAHEFHCSDGNGGRPTRLSDLFQHGTPSDSRRPDRLSLSLHGPDGAQRWFDVICVRIPVPGLGAAYVFSDHTEQHLASLREIERQQQLAHASRLSTMGQFASVLAHELGQPLNASLSYVAGIEHRLGPDALDRHPDARDALIQIQRHLTQAGDIIHNLRGFLGRRRPGAGAALDLDALIRSSLALLRPQLREAGVRVDLHLDPVLPPVHGDRVELQQVLVNLILNAVEAMRDAHTQKPRVRMEVGPARGGCLALCVDDNGPGIPPQVRESLFDPYITTKAEGLGMGLMLCRTIAEAHGGSLRLDGRRRHGARFTLALPVAR